MTNARSAPQAGRSAPQAGRSAPQALTERLYAALYEDDDARVCKDISDEACRVVPGNFFLNTLAQALTKLGDALMNPKTTLPWLLVTLQAPGWVAGFLVPVRESGSMLPQLGIAAWLRTRPVRKWAFVAGSLAQGLAVVGLALTAGLATGTVAGVAVLALVIMFSLSRGFSSVASKDVLGKTVPKTRRGRVTGFAGSVAGIGVLACAALLWQTEASQRPYALLLAASGSMWFVAAAVYARIREYPGATEGGGNGLLVALGRLSLLRDDAVFRRFLAARALLVGSGLAAPFLVVLGHERADTSLAGFFLAQGLAAVLSGPAWSAFADRSSRRLLIVTACGAGALGTVVFAVDRLAPQVAGSVWFLPAAFFLLSLLHDGVRLARKTYVVDMAGGNRRTDYVAVGNSLIGLWLLVVGGLSAGVQALSTGAAVLMLSLAAFGAAWLARRLPET